MQERTERSGRRFAALGAAFLLAASAVGPGFLIQTTRFSAEGGQPFFYAVLLVTLADIVTKANIWSVVGAAGLTGAQIADRVQKGLGTVLTVAVVIGGLAFNTGNIGGAALGLSAVSGVPERVGVLVCAALAAGVFCFRGAKRIVDVLAVILGGIIVCAVLAVCVKTQPPILSTVRALPQPSAALSMFFPLITLLGGACGGYIPFSGAHRLLESGSSSPKPFRRAAVLGASVSGVIRFSLFFAVIGVCCAGKTFLAARAAAIAGSDNPAAETFLLAWGAWGKRLFGVTLFCAGFATTIGASYTSVSFLKTLHPFFARNERFFIPGMIACSALILLIFGNATGFAILSGTVNGFVLPISLGCILLAAHSRAIVGDYRHPLPLTIAGWIVAALSLVLAIRLLVGLFLPA